MPRRSTVATLLLAISSGACRDPRPWQEPGWVPAAPPARVVAGSVLAARVVQAVDPWDRLVAVHELARDPGFSLVADEASGLPTVGASPEQLLSARPDLVVVDAFTRAETLALLAAADVPVVRTADPRGFDDIGANVRRIGEVTHLAAAADRLARAMQQRLAAIRDAGRDLPPWRVLSLDGALHTYGRGSLFDAVVTAAGARNVAAEHGVGPFRKLDVEEVLSWRPDAIVLSLPPDGEPGTPEWLRQMPGMQLLPCVAKGRLVFVPGALLGTTSHRLVDAVELLQRRLRAWGAP